MSEKLPELKKEASIETSKEISKDTSDVKIKKENTAKKMSGGVKRFFIETKSELKKIVWPTSKQVVNNTIIVLITILVVGVFIWGLDALTSQILKLLTNK